MAKKLEDVTIKINTFFLNFEGTVAEFKKQYGDKAGMVGINMQALENAFKEYDGQKFPDNLVLKYGNLLEYDKNRSQITFTMDNIKNPSSLFGVLNQAALPVETGRGNAPTTTETKPRRANTQKPAGTGREKLPTDSPTSSTTRRTTPLSPILTEGTSRVGSVLTEQGHSNPFEGISSEGGDVTKCLAVLIAMFFLASGENDSSNNPLASFGELVNNKNNQPTIFPHQKEM